MTLEYLREYRTYFHLHTHCSDGQMSPQDLMRQALDIGLKGLAITDHHSIEGYQQAQIWLESLSCLPLNLFVTP